MKKQSRRFVFVVKMCKVSSGRAGDYMMTQAAPQQSGRHTGTMAMPPFDSE